MPGDVIRIPIGSMLAGCAAASATAAVVTSTWIGPAAGNWAGAANWSPRGVPGNDGSTTYAVVIDDDARSAVTVDVTGSVTIDALEVRAGDGVVIHDGVHFSLAGDSLVVDGSLSVEGARFATILQVASSRFTIGGAGELRFSDTQANLLTASSAALLTIAPEQTLRGAFTIGGKGLALVNEGAILADSSAGVTVLIGNGGSFEHHGMLCASAGDVFISNGEFAECGEVVVDERRTLTRDGPFPQTGGVVRVDGTLSLGDAHYALEQGELGGSGRVDAMLLNIGGIVSPGPGIAVLSIEKSCVQQRFGTLSIEIGGAKEESDHDRLVVTGDAELDGTLLVTRVDGFAARPTDSFPILTCTGIRTGAFHAVVSCDEIEVTYGPASVSISFPNSTGVVGDLNFDGLVNGADVTVVLGNWGPCGEACCPGDANGDGMVDGADITVVLGNWAP